MDNYSNLYITQVVIRVVSTIKVHNITLSGWLVPLAQLKFIVYGYSVLNGDREIGYRDFTPPPKKKNLEIQ